MISVIIPAYNSEKTIYATLNSLINQDYPKKDYEIIVVDDGSTDKTKEVVKKFKKVKLIEQKHKGPAAARNFGAKNARGEIILFTDSDCVPTKKWIKRMVEPFKNKEIVGVSGAYRTLNKNSLIARFAGYEIEQRHEKMKKEKFIDFIGTFSAGYRKKIFMKFGGFEERFKTSSGEDPELSFRIAKSGYKLVFQPNAIVFHPHPDTLFKYLRQKYHRAIWRNLMYKKHKEKIFSDSYTHKTLVPQTLLSGFIMILFPLLLFLNFDLKFLLFIPILLFFISFFLNLDIIFYIWKKEKKVALLSPFIFLLRNIVVVIGAAKGILMVLSGRM